MDNRIVQLSKSKKNIVGLFKILQWVFFAFFVLYCLVVIAVSLYSFFQPYGYEYVAPDSVFSIVSIVFNVVAGGMAIFILWIISRRIGKGSSPFTFRIATLLTVLAFVLLASFLSILLINPGTQIGAVNDADSTAMAFEYYGEYDSDSRIDVKMLITCIACFAMSAVFRYGAILQIEADDLV